METLRPTKQKSNISPHTHEPNNKLKKKNVFLLFFWEILTSIAYKLHEPQAQKAFKQNQIVQEHKIINK